MSPRISFIWSEDPASEEELDLHEPNHLDIRPIVARQQTQTTVSAWSLSPVIVKEVIESENSVTAWMPQAIAREAVLPAARSDDAGADAGAIRFNICRHDDGALFSLPG